MILLSNKLLQTYGNDIVDRLTGKLGGTPTFPMYLMNVKAQLLLNYWNAMLFKNIFDNTITGQLVREDNMNYNISHNNIDFLEIHKPLFKNDLLLLEVYNDILSVVRDYYFNYSPTAWTEEIQLNLRNLLVQKVQDYTEMDMTNPELPVANTPFTEAIVNRFIGYDGYQTDFNTFKGYLEKFIQLDISHEVLNDLFNGSRDFPPTSDGAYDLFNKTLQEAKIERNQTALVSKIVVGYTDGVPDLKCGLQFYKVNTTKIEAGIEMFSDKPLLLQTDFVENKQPHLISYIPDNGVVFFMGYSQITIPEDEGSKQFINYSFVSASVGYDKFLLNFDFQSPTFTEDLFSTHDIFIKVPKDFENLPQPDFENVVEELKSNKVKIDFIDNFYILKSVFF